MDTPQEDDPAPVAPAYVTVDYNPAQVTYAHINPDGDPVDLLACSACGATVGLDETELHTQWHAAIGKSIEVIAGRLAELDATPAPAPAPGPVQVSLEGDAGDIVMWVRLLERAGVVIDNLGHHPPREPGQGSHAYGTLALRDHGSTG